MDDVRYSELLFLQKWAKAEPSFQNFFNGGEQQIAVGLNGNFYAEMAASMLENLYVRFDESKFQLLVAKLRGELSPNHGKPYAIDENHWTNPREGIMAVLAYGGSPRLVITYRGLSRIEELRELLKRDRILEHFGVLLDLRYVHIDLQSALQRSSDVPISVLYADLDGFKQINDGFGHAAGDVVLKKYLEVIHDSLGSFGVGYRGRGDEVVAIIPGQGHDKAVALAEKIRKNIEAMKCEYNGKLLPKVTTSIGMATTPPESRAVEIENIAESRNRLAKKSGKNQVVSKT